MAAAIEGPLGVKINSQRGVIDAASLLTPICVWPGSPTRLARNQCFQVSVTSDEARLDRPRNAGRNVMKKQKRILLKIVMVSALLYPAYALAQISGGHSGSSATGSSGTTGLASDQAHISPPGTNSLGTANPSDGTVGLAGSEPQESRQIDREIRAEDARIDAKINNICRGC
jgi:hypothetical protein